MVGALLEALVRFLGFREEEGGGGGGCGGGGGGGRRWFWLKMSSEMRLFTKFR